MLLNIFCLYQLVDRIDKDIVEKMMDQYKDMRQILLNEVKTVNVAMGDININHLTTKLKLYGLMAYGLKWY